jgi:hypothetical protein
VCPAVVALLGIAARVERLVAAVQESNLSLCWCFLVMLCAAAAAAAVLGETLLRKLGRADMIKKQSVPEIVFAYFHNK